MAEKTEVIVMSKGELEALIEATVKRTIAENTGDHVMTDKEVADLLGVTTTTVRRYVEGQGLPAHALSPRELRFMRTEVMAWISQRKETAA